MRIDGKTRVCALIGDPVEHSMSPAMHNAAFKELNLKYVCFNVKSHELMKAFDGVRALDILGVNITVPYKIDVMDFLDEIDPIAKKIGSVNTVVNHRGKLKGFNTDWLGLVMSIEEYTSLKGKSVVLLGAGGAARAIAYGVILKGGKLTILNRTIDKAKKLSEELGCDFGGLDEIGKLNGEILINSTSSSSDLATREQLKNFKYVLDISYNPLITPLLKEAEKAGCTSIDGLKMLVYQGAASFELWTGQTPDIDLMHSEAKRALTKNA